MIASGKYGEIARVLNQMLEAESVVLIVVKGKMGNGFSVSTLDPEINRHLPKLMRAMADFMDREGGHIKDADAIEKIVNAPKEGS